MAGLHVEVTGQGEPLVMLHGWGMHGGLWSGAAEQLSQHFTVMAVDLPGHGYSVDSRCKAQDTRDKAE